ncbi:MAG: GTP-binding protein [Candidatus Omnitrophica bacterium]|nr:GTP-binding protein [Candidatus Omnitrophota bacterium]
MHNFNLIFSGHIDHGKSTLIGRLMMETKSLPADKLEGIKEYSALADNFFEERAEARTIDTTQMFFSTSKRRYTVIDAPGHLEFIKNMLTGASEADAAVLIIDAAEGLGEQTMRHLCLLSFIGIKEIIVAINKMDLINFSSARFEELRQALRPVFTALALKESFCIPISALYGKNITRRAPETRWYTGPTLIKAMDMLAGRVSREHSDFMLPIQDVYAFGGKKVFAGRIESGSIEPGRAVKIVPSGIRSTIKSIEKFSRNPLKSIAGESIGITFTDDISFDRGEVVCDTGALPVISDSINVNLFWLSELPLNTRDKLSLRCSTQEAGCSVTEITEKFDSLTLKSLGTNASFISNTEFSKVRISTEKPIVVMSFNKIPSLGRIVFFRNLLPCAAGTLAP